MIPMIPIAECKPGYLYIIDARNSRLGIYVGPEQGAFTISRYKFGSNYLFDEFHWDTGEPFGTVQPLKELLKAPEFKTEDEKLAWLNQMAIDHADEILTAHCPPENQDRIRKTHCPKCMHFPKEGEVCSLDRDCIRQSLARFKAKGNENV